MIDVVDVVACGGGANWVGINSLLELERRAPDATRNNEQRAAEGARKARNMTAAKLAVSSTENVKSVRCTS